MWSLMLRPRMSAAFARFICGRRELHATCLAAATGLDLRLDDDGLANLRGRRLRPASASVTTSPKMVGTSWAANSSLAWYSYRSTCQLR